MNTKHIVMRRVYYSYTLSLVTSEAFIQGFVLGGAVALFGRLTHVAAIWNNLLAVPVGRLPEYVSSSVQGALAGGEVLTVMVTLLIVGMSIRLCLLLLETRPKYRLVQ